MAAVPIIAAVVGTAATVNSTVRANQQAARQRESLRTSQSANALSTEMVLLEIEQQKLFNQQQRQLNDQARLQEYMVNQQQQTIQKQQLEQQAGIQSSNAQIQDQLTNRQALVTQGQTTQQQNNQNLQLQVQKQLQDINNLTSSFYSNAGLDINRAGDAFNRANVLRSQNISAEDQKLATSNELSSQMQDLYTQYQSASEQGRTALRNKAAALVALSQGGQVNESVRAALDEQSSELDQATMNQILNSRQQEFRLGQDAGLSNQRINEEIERIRKNFLIQDTLTNLSGDTQKDQINKNSTIASVSNDAGFLSNMLNVQQQAALRNYGTNLDLSTGIGTNYLNNQATLDTLGLDRAALDILSLTQGNTFSLGNAQSELDQQFGEIALNSRAAGVQSAANSERAAINSQINGIRSPGAFPILSAGINLGGTVLSTLNQGNTAFNSTNPFFSNEPIPILNKPPK